MARVKNRMISMRLTEAQYQKFINIISEIRLNYGFAITRTSLILKMLEYGLPELEKELKRSKKEKRSA